LRPDTSRYGTVTNETPASSGASPSACGETLLAAMLTPVPQTCASPLGRSLRGRAEGPKRRLQDRRASCVRVRVRLRAREILSATANLPGWLRAQSDYSIWQRNNRWILRSALSRTDSDVTLIVLWDGKGGDGPGGTADIVALAQAGD
jgi:hypothetical protein